MEQAIVNEILLSIFLKCFKLYLEKNPEDKDIFIKNYSNDKLNLTICKYMEKTPCVMVSCVDVIDFSISYVGDMYIIGYKFKNENVNIDLMIDLEKEIYSLI